MTGATQATSCPAGTSTLATGSTSASDCLAASQITEDHITQAIQSGGLVAAQGGNAGANQFNAWVQSVTRAIGFLSGPQKQAGCVQIRNAIAKAQGARAVVGGTAVGQVVSDLQWVSQQNGCN